jgi:hypothetical protein
MRNTKKETERESFLAGRRKDVLIGQPEDLESICFLLNSVEPLELCAELRRLVDVWLKSGPNLAKMLKEDPVLEARATHGRTLLVPTEAGRGYLLWLPAPHRFNPIRWKHQALAHFMNLIVNPQWDMLGGPCQRCQKYYAKKTVRQKTCCSRRCGSASTAAATTRKRREAERVQKLRLAQEAADKWITFATARLWKVWVSDQTKITIKWLTRACNKGELRVPIRHHY